jgi:hypothetical protein
MLFGYGNQRFLDVSYDYQVYCFQFPLYYPIQRMPNLELDLVIQPYFNTTRIQNIEISKKKPTGYELGLQLGVFSSHTFARDHFSIGVGISSGPGYVSKTPRRQVSGFIFSNNLWLGLDIKISKNLDFGLQAGFRHQSNAGIKNPNQGINNMLFNVGLLAKVSDN